MKHIFLFCLVAIALGAQGQYYHKRNNADSTRQFFRPKQITLILDPVIIENGKYYFDGRPITYEGMMLPMISLNDKKINKRMRTIRTLTHLRSPIRWVGFAYLVYGGTRVIPTQNGVVAYIYTLAGIYVFERLFDLSIALAKRNAIKRYNELVLMPSASISPSTGFSLGCTIRF